MPRTSLKIVGASGQGINSIGAIIAKGLKRSGYCVFGYREYKAISTYPSQAECLCRIRFLGT